MLGADDTKCIEMKTFMKLNEVLFLFNIIVNTGGKYLFLTLYFQCVLGLRGWGTRVFFVMIQYSENWRNCE